MDLVVCFVADAWTFTCVLRAGARVCVCVRVRIVRVCGAGIDL